MKNANEGYVLGIDLGSNSLGYALIGLNKGVPAKIIHAGSNIFEAGVDGDIESGKDSSRNAVRQEKRSTRRLLQRRNRRLIKLANILRHAKLLPPGDIRSAVLRDTYFANLDKTIIARYTENLPKSDPRRQALSLLPYFLRAKALDEALKPDEIGRALYHLAQRRGFLSNRKVDKVREGDEAKEKELGKVKEDIALLTAEMEATHTRTLGEFFSKINPETNRLRRRWTSRQMYLDEFEKIWTSQAKHYPEILTDEIKKKIHLAIFYQRPLKSQKHLIGNCSLEPKAKRSRWGLLLAQEFRMLSTVNNLTITDTETGEITPLTTEQRAVLLNALEKQNEMSFGGMRKLLKIKKVKFNLEEGGEKKILGNRTAAKIIAVMGADCWNKYSTQQRDKIVQELMSLEDNKDILRRRAEKEWKLDFETAEHFANINLEPGYCNISTKAIKKLLPHLQEGLTYAEARMKGYGKVTVHTEPVEKLEPLTKVLRSLRNPAVARSLTLLRKTVNSIIAKYGKPSEIHIELARDLKKNRKDREEIWKKNRKNETARESAATQLKDKIRLLAPKGMDIQKVLLAEECGWVCPYTGKQISMSALVGPSPQFDIEHIIPLSKCLDNSFFNKTLCYHEENRSAKKGNTPYEAYSGDTEKYNRILERIRKFSGLAAKEKLRRFQATDLDDFDDFTSRQLNDTRYASRLAADYLGTLYGGRCDENGKLRIIAGRGRTTKFLRDEWDLNSVLGDGGLKNRGDHRHHTIDAIAIALTTPATVKMLSDAASRAERTHRRNFASVEPPWPTFIDDVHESIGKLKVYHRPKRSVSGPLHEETIYSPPCDETGRPDPDGQYRHIRKPLENLSTSELNEIADAKVKVAVHLALGANEPKKVFANCKLENLPFLVTKDGRHIPIKRVRLLKKITTTAIGSGSTQRHIKPGSNHHVEIYLDEKTNKWDGSVVATLEAKYRLKIKQPLVVRDHGTGKKFLFSLCGGDILEMDEENGLRALYVVRSVWMEGTPRFALVPINDARKANDRKGDRYQPKVSKLQKLNAQKVIITPLGEVRRAND